MKKALLFLFVTVTLFLLLGELFLPAYVEREVERHLRGQVREADGLEIEAISFPALKLLFTRADRVFLEADRLDLEGLILRSVDLRYSDVSINSGRLKGENDYIYLEISEESINSYVAENYSRLKNFQLNFTPENVYMEGRINLLGNEIEVKLTGNLVLQPEDIIAFVPGDLQIDEYRVSEELIRNMAGKLDFSFDLNKLRIPLSPEEIRIREGEVHVFGGSRGEAENGDEQK
ncbi:MAG: DUF2993 domain-containing protein [Halanaerobiaceae bacterium]